MQGRVGVRASPARPADSVRQNCGGCCRRRTQAAERLDQVTPNPISPLATLIGRSSHIFGGPAGSRDQPGAPTGSGGGGGGGAEGGDHDGDEDSGLAVAPTVSRSIAALAGGLFSWDTKILGALATPPC